MNKPHRGVGFGAFLLSIGILWLLVNLNVIQWSILGALLTLWPLIIVAAGINIIFRQNEYVKALTWLGFVAVLVVYGMWAQPSAWSISKNMTFHWNGSNGKTTTWTSDKADAVKTGRLDVNIGGGSLRVSGKNDGLADVRANEDTMEISKNVDGETGVVNVSGKKGLKSGMGPVEVSLNKSLPWKISLDSGMTEATLDLSDIRTERLDINTGAGKYHVTLGAQPGTTTVKVDGGVSSMTFSVPKSAGIRCKLDGLVSKNFENHVGWIKDGDTWHTDNFDSAESKIDMDVDMGVANFEINRN